MIKEIGSNFWLETEDICYFEKQFKPKIKHCDSAFISHGRHAISYVLEDINTNANKKTALLPIYTCSSVITPFVKAEYDVHYYEVEEDLSVDKDKFIKILENINPNVVLLHSFFGFDTLSEIKTLDIKEYIDDVVVIEDVTQSYFSSNGFMKADYYISSLRKWVAIPDGAFAIKKGDKFRFRPKKSDAKSSEITSLMLEAFRLKKSFIEGEVVTKDSFMNLYSLANIKIDQLDYIYEMSDYSIKYISSYNLFSMCYKRRENYNYLYNEIQKLNSKNIQPLLGKADESTVPLYFLVKIDKERDKFQEYLSKNLIFAPVIWPKSKYITKSTFDDLYNTLLAIPCDQRYDIEDMHRIVEVIIKYEKEYKK